MNNYKVETGMKSPIAVKRGGNDAHPSAPIKAMEGYGRTGYIEPRGYAEHMANAQAHDKGAKSASKYKGGR